MNIGILNLMPDGLRYEQELHSLFAEINNVALKRIAVGVNTDNKTNYDSGPDYYSYSNLVADEWMDVLIVTGAPVEKKRFEDVHWWEPLRSILLDSINRGIYTLGICWGGMAIAKILGIEKVVMSQKVFGLHKFKNILSGHPLMQDVKSEFFFPVSTHAVLSNECVQQKISSGSICGLAYNDSIGYGLLVSPDSKILICLAHPEYRVERLLAEYRRDWGVDLLEPDFLHRSSSGLMFNQAIDKTVFFRWFKSIEEEISLNA